jgi:hypothetical protein
VVPKPTATPFVHVDGDDIEVTVAPGAPFEPASIDRPGPVPAPSGAATATVRLIDLAWGRSGDKGDKSNIGIIAREAAYLPWIAAALTPERVKAYFGDRVQGTVERFYLPGIDAFNFLMDRALGGGGIASLRNDPQGKAMAQQLLDIEIPVPDDIAARVAG